MTTALVVDDDPLMLRVLRISLTAHGCTVVTAADGAGALRSITEITLTVVVLNLPDMDAPDVIAGIRSRTTAD